MKETILKIIESRVDSANVEGTSEGLAEEILNLLDPRLEIRTWKAKRNIPPQMILNLDIDDLNYTGDTVTTLLIKKGDKVARINLSVAENDGKVKAALSADGPNRTTQKTVNAIFGWEQDPNDPKAVEYPVGDERRRTPA